jgi:hypothetical protein
MKAIGVFGVEGSMLSVQFYFDVKQHRTRNTEYRTPKALTARLHDCTTAFFYQQTIPSGFFQPHNCRTA